MEATLSGVPEIKADMHVKAVGAKGKQPFGGPVVHIVATKLHDGSGLLPFKPSLFAATAAYGLWGFLPLYFQFLGDMPPLVILAHRIVWSVPTALILVIAAGKWGEFAGVFRAPRMLFTLLASSIAIAANWTIYIWAVTNGRVVEASLGYFIFRRGDLP